MHILGIDPGYERLGVAILEHDKKKSTLIFSSCITTSSKLPHADRLLLIGKGIRDVIEKYTPDHTGIETLFFNTNQKTALLVSEARGVIIYESSRGNIPVFEYTPLQVKIAVCGYGRGTKDQVTSMLHKLVKIDKKITHDDEYDAIAVALTHAVSYRSPSMKHEA